MGVNCLALLVTSQASLPGSHRRPGTREVAQGEVLTDAPAQSRPKAVFNASPVGLNPKWAGGIWKNRQEVSKTDTQELVRPQKPELEKFLETSKNNDMLLSLLINNS